MQEVLSTKNRLTLQGIYDILYSSYIGKENGMNRFFAEEITDGKAYLSSEDAYHLKNVLRARLQERFEVCDGESKEYIASLVALDKQSAVLEILEDVTVEREPKRDYYICQGMPKGKKSDDVVRHGTELGMRGFCHVISQRVIVKNPGDYDKSDRLQRIADEAAKQSKRIRIPKVMDAIKLEELVRSAPKDALRIIAWEEETELSLKKCLDAAGDPKEVYILVGPEGGFERDEVELAKSYGWQSVTLGKRILRTETAPLSMLSAVAYYLGDME